MSDVAISDVISKTEIHVFIKTYRMIKVPRGPVGITVCSQANFFNNLSMDQSIETVEK